MKERLDLILQKKGLASSRQRAKYLIESGFVKADGKVITKAGTKLEEDAEILITGDAIPYVSRGGLKLRKALEVFNISANGKVCLDVGASTGGFTDCLLQKGAKLVYALDSGHGQLAPSLLNRSNVVNLEGINAKDIRRELFAEPIQIVTADVSFISLRKVLPAMKEVSEKSADIICLVKPQFEAGRADVGKHGVVKNPKVHIRILQEVTGFAAEIGLYPTALDYSPIKGPEGNIEYLLYMQKEGKICVGLPEIMRTVENSHQERNYGI